MIKLASYMLSTAVLVACTAGADGASEPPTVVVVVGAAGQPEYGEQFQTWADRWQQAAQEAGATFVQIGGEIADAEADGTDRERLKQLLAGQANAAESPLWLILIGHGTFFRDVANFNLSGPDVSSQELGEWLQPVERPLVVVNCASSSGPYIRDLAGPDRVVVTATQSGAEQNYARFGDYFSAAINDPSADLDHDEQVSLLEAFLSASGRVAQFYQDEARLATEHALLDDNGDGLGTSASFYRGVRAVRQARDDAPVDGRRAARLVLVPSDVDRGFTPEQLARREAIEQEINALRDQKDALDEDAYYQQLEVLLVQLARLYDEVEAERDEDPATSPVEEHEAESPRESDQATLEGAPGNADPDPHSDP